MTMSNSELQNEAVAVLTYEQIYNEFVRGRLSGDKNVFERTYAPRLREGSVRNTTAGEKGKRYIRISLCSDEVMYEEAYNRLQNFNN